MFPCSLIYCVIGLSVSGLRKIRFNAYTPRRISTKKSVPKQTRIPIVRVDNFSLVSLCFPVPWFIVLSVWLSAVYAKYVSTPFTLRRISTKKSVPKQTRIPIVRVDNFSLLSLCFPVPWFIVLSVWVSAVYAKYVSTPIHPVEFPQKNQFPNKPGFPLSALIILVWYPYVSLFLDLLCYRFECQRFTQNTFQRLYTPSNFHKKISSQTNQDSHCPRW